MPYKQVSLSIRSLRRYVDRGLKFQVDQHITLFQHHDGRIKRVVADS